MANSPISKSTPPPIPPLYRFVLLSSKNFRTPPPSDSIFRKPYPSFNKGGGGGKGIQTILLGSPPPFLWIPHPPPTLQANWSFRSPSFQFRCCTQRKPSSIISKQLWRKDFSMEQIPIDSNWLLSKQKNSISVNQWMYSF